MCLSSKKKEVNDVFKDKIQCLSSCNFNVKPDLRELNCLSKKCHINLNSNKLTNLYSTTCLATANEIRLRTMEQYRCKIYFPPN